MQYYVSAGSGNVFLGTLAGLVIVIHPQLLQARPRPCVTNANCPPGGVCISPGGIARGGYCCLPTGPEVCDGLDNDCSGMIDDRGAASSCGDGSACTKDYCRGGTCLHQPVVCTDSNACTDNSCDPLVGCVTAPTDCDDENLCTIDSCLPASGCQHDAIVCPPDNDQCTNDACDPPTGGCPYRPRPDGFPCDDGIACTDGSFCLDTACVGGTSNCPQGPNLCNTAFCDYESGECGGHQLVCPPSPVPNCFDVVCFGNNGICQTQFIGEGLPDCEDVPACETDDECADNDACTIDRCAPDGTSFSCQYAFVNKATFCNDNNPCTVDTCRADIGCENRPLNPIDGCGGDDGLACTTQVCDPARGGCAKDLDHSLCDDGIASSLDVCDPNLGCLNPPDPDFCGNGVCDLPGGEHASNCPADCVGANSCLGPNACAGATGQIGENSCHGFQACANAGGVIGDNSCHNPFGDNNAGACGSNTGTIGNNSCYEYRSCTVNSGEIGNNSCQVSQACWCNEIDIGNDQCNASCACFGPQCAIDCGG